MKKTEGRVAIVTGGASGIGAATVARYAREGIHVVSTDIQDGPGRRIADAAGAVFIEQDTSQEAGWERVTSYAREHFGRLDILVNNAGMMIAKSIEDMDLHTWQRMIAVNLTGVMLGCQYAIRTMKRNPGGSSGSIINISSLTAYAALPGDVAYAATKSGVRMMTKSVAVYCGKAGLNIRCNSIHPGAIETAMTAEHSKHLAKISPLNRMGTADEIAAAALFLASDESSFITGSEVLVDGGTMAVHPGF